MKSARTRELFPGADERIMALAVLCVRGRAVGIRDVVVGAVYQRAIENVRYPQDKWEPTFRQYQDERPWL